MYLLLLTDIFSLSVRMELVKLFLIFIVFSEIHFTEELLMKNEYLDFISIKEK